MSGRAEANHEAGRIGAFNAKMWLEATTFLEIPFDSYNNAGTCTIECMNGLVKTFDLHGNFHKTQTSKARPVYVEAKAYSSSGGQGPEFEEFLAIAYSATARPIKILKVDKDAEFIWFTTHPFQVTKWSQLASRDEIKNALNTYPKYSEDGKGGVDESILDLVVNRIWLIVFSEKQLDITLNFEEARLASLHLKRGLDK